MVMNRTVAAALLLLPLVAACSRPDPVPMTPGISRELAEHRAESIGDVRYDLALDLTSRDTATGHVVIAFERRGDGDVILDFRGPRLGRVTLNGEALEEIEYDGAHIRIPAGALRDGENLATFEFAARIAPSGASIIRYDDATDSTSYLYTLLVPADANQLFPCFDQPDLKARVTLALTVPSAWTAVANGELVTADSGAEGATTFRFAETQPISTYLIGFATGPWETVTRTARGREITMYVRASRADEAEADSLIAANARAVAWLEEYFGMPFPFSKVDFVLAPAFPFGGMEHPGAIFYSEDRFIFRERPTRPQLLRREETIYHEIAHQWFGDLVTMRWFDDLWLKEGFATYMAAKMQAASSPESEAWKTFYLRHKPPAYAVDRSKGTTPVWQALTNLDQAKSNYGPIVYNKAPGILKQLNYLVGDSAFRAGVRAFLIEYSYSNATWEGLLEAVGTAAGRPLTDWGEHYILRPGMPVLEQSVAVKGGRIQGITLRQHPARAISGSGQWPIRTEVLFGGAGTPVRVPVEVNGAEQYVSVPAGAPAPHFAFANAGDYAYAAVTLDSVSADWLMEHVGEIDDGLLRAMAWGALWDRVRDAELSPVRYLSLVARELPNERDEEIAAVLLRRTVRAATAYLLPAEQDSALPALARVLRRHLADAEQSYSIRKASLDALIAVAGDSATVRYIDALLDGTFAGEPLRAPTRWAIVTRLVELGTPTAARRLAAEVQRDSTDDGRRWAFIAGAARPSADAKQEYFTRYLADSTLNEEWVTASLGEFNAITAQELTLPYLRPALDTLPWIQRHRRIFFLGAWLDAFLQGHTTPDALRTVDEYLAEHPDLPDDLRRKVLVAMDELERTVAIRGR